MVKTNNKRQVVDITNSINNFVVKNTNRGKLLNIVALHTTCAITTADLDPGTDIDYLEFIKSLTPSLNFNHPHNPGHFPDHMWSTLIGTNITLPFGKSGVALGQWQRIVLLELDGPRERTLELTTI